ncbi:hypothetical protein QLQ12_45990 [Actinoplanes sp. NEAU-A12]|uniref:Uncharacterized protein n=1 Tax=Actinoplanes sandaracinus TaxID=3045177 RepID=A0ABT6X1R0_9ACTN|nr:hypothetical protein [Actinoplanes sandaracinus]MDI6105946.1 hypothetical protein [Actinoplanes sandaracinus]
MVRWTVVESSYGGGGHGFARIVPRDGGGSRLHAELVNTELRRQKLMLTLLHLVPDRMVARMWTAALDRYALTHDT